MNTIIWKGVPSTNIDGLLICELPPISKPPLRVKETTIDGRDGSIIEELGYSSYDKSITIGLRGNFDINKVIKYFTGEGEIIFSNEPDKVYTAKIVDKIDYNSLLRFRKAVVKFRVQPFKHKYNEAYKEAPTVAYTGTSIVVTKKEDDILKSFSIYGKTTQDGTPTPDAPVDIVSLCADGTIAVTVNDTTVDLSVANGLRGIPVTDKSLATYTDASGQMWCADEIDLKNGVYIQRVASVVFDGSEVWTAVTTQTSGKYRFLCALGDKAMSFPTTIVPPLMCNQKKAVGVTTTFALVSGITTAELGDTLYFYDEAFNTENSALLKQHLAKKPMVVHYLLATPNYTPLTDDLNVNGLSTIANDENAHMKVEYFKPFEVFNEGLENSKPKMVLHGSGTVGISVNGVHIFDYTFPEGETEVVIDSEKEDAYLGEVLKNRNMNGEFPILLAGTNKIEWSGDVESIEILPRSRWL